MKDVPANLERYRDMWSVEANAYILVRTTSDFMLPYLVLDSDMCMVIIDDDEKVVVEVMNRMRSAGCKVLDLDEYRELIDQGENEGT